MVATDGKTAFVGAMSFGVMSFDVRNPSQIKHLTTFQPNIHFPKQNPNSIGHPNARGMALRGKLLYVACDAGGLRILNVANPRSPCS